MHHELIQWFKDTDSVAEVHVDAGKHDYVFKELIYEIDDSYPAIQDVPEGCKHVSVTVCQGYTNGIDWANADGLHYVHKVQVTTFKWRPYAP